MKKINIVRKNEEFNDIIREGTKSQSQLFYLYFLKNSYSYNRYGIAISKKIGNAVVRNKYKRQIKDIIDDINISITGFDFILIAKTNIKNYKYKDIKENISKMFIVLGEKDEKK